jgi:hypothetical protein
MSDNKLFDVVRTELLSIPGQIAERVTKPLDATQKHVAEVHAVLLEALQAGKAAGGRDERDALARYRASVVTDISTYLLESIQDTNAGATVGSIFTDCKQRLSQIVADAPEEALPEDGTRHYLPRRRTSALKRVRKVGSRLFKRLRSEEDAVVLEIEYSPRQLFQFKFD